MKNLLIDFGFCGYKSVLESTFRICEIKFLWVFSLVGGVLSHLTGLAPYSVWIILVLMVAELIFGITAGVRRYKKFSSKRLQRFGLKVFIYFLLLLVLTAFKRQYSESSPEYYIYYVLHSFVVFYIVGVYIISILEKISYLTGRSEEIETLIKVFRLRLRKSIKHVEDLKDE